MTVIKSISGIRGTVGGSLTDGFNPLTIAHFVVGYAQHIKLYESISSPSDVVYTAKLAQITTLVKTIGVPMVWNERRIAFL